MFSPLENLMILVLEFNHIQILDNGLFAKNGDLKILDISDNNIRRIDGVLFHPRGARYFVSVANNELITLDTIHFSNTRHLYAFRNRIQQLYLRGNVEVLDADRNNIENVICDEVSDNKLSTLSLAYNLLSDVSFISSLTELNDLNLSHNNLERINQSTFAATTRLTKLSLKSANIGRLDNGIFTHQTQLQVLDVSYNQLGNIDVLGLLASSKSLQILYIDGNNITEFSYDHLKRAFSSLLAIGIGDNSFNCTFLGQLITQLNSDHISVVSNSGKHAIYTENVNGIGCQGKKDVQPSSVLMPNDIIETVGASNLEGNGRWDAEHHKLIPQLSQLIVKYEENFQRLFEDISAIERQIIELNSGILKNEGELLKLNRINDIVLEKQHLINRAQERVIDQLKFEIKKINREFTSETTTLIADSDFVADKKNVIL